MLIRLNTGTTKDQIKQIISKLGEYNSSANLVDLSNENQSFKEILALPEQINSQTNGVDDNNSDIISLSNKIFNNAELKEKLKNYEFVEKLYPINSKFPILARSQSDNSTYKFTYNDVEFSQEGFEIFAGLNTADNIKNIEITFQKLKQLNIRCTRVGMYKPRTSPYSFQGLETKHLEEIFELAQQYGIKVISMEITSEKGLNDVTNILERNGSKAGLMIQIGTRNAQNFELLKAIGRQKKYPVLFKRGFGISLDESLNAAEYIAKEGNNKIIFCLRGMKSNFANPHRNFLDFSHVSTIKRLTKMPVCIDPSHAIGSLSSDQQGITDLVHANAQGIIAGANMLLIDVHPSPEESLVDAKQALSLEQLELLIKDSKLVRECYLERRKIFCY